MGVLSSLFSGVSGINANGTSLSVIGNNIANTNTVGFKGSRTVFSDVLSGSAGSKAIGRGVLVSAIDKDLTQGSFEGTGNVLDVAIDGEGFFVVNDGVGNLYTRAGVFGIDSNGNVVNPEGLTLQAYQADTTGTITGQLGPIQVTANISNPNPTGNVTANSNLDSRASFHAAPGFDVTSPVATSDHSSAITVYDSLGTGHSVTMYYTKVVSDTSNQWQWNAVVSASDATSGVDTVAATGYLDFTSAGALNTEALAAPVGYTAIAAADFDFNGGATQNQSIAINFGTSIAEGGTGLDGTTQFGVPSSTSFQSQDGYGPGQLQEIAISTDGRIDGQFNNGISRVIGQLAIASFNNPGGITPQGSNLFSESFESGAANIGVGESGGRGRVLSNSLELSNVDLAAEFIKMISAQRAFQANSRVITSTDEVLRDMVNIIR
ncbi:MAG: flagellar hook protein FlgE [Leptospirillia bacterium]